ncbi:histidine kinase [Mucilaginibacter sp. HMF5004]|uniref:sensor histidine kinase n=1 Tax=Mucilaginibacter rivuli TaxID=2857527 RepID=UPI001C5EA660|nr:histidine kinase [Mucilaginibacter rivuli]MBW4888930.1 histidine kinase [Mucilaginibacter rivuli]
MKNTLRFISTHIIGWTLLLMVPFISMHQVVKSLVPNIEEMSFVPVIVFGMFLISTFYFNYFVLIPKFLMVKMYGLYIITFLGTLLIVLGISWTIFHAFGGSPEQIESMNPVLQKISPIAKANGLLTLLVLFVVSISMALSERLKKTESEKLSAQLSSLKSQINPHFLFNTLNSICVTAIDESPATAEMVQKLSEMMRYTMKDTQNDFVPLEEELRYINNYIDLQKVRLDSSIKLDFSITGAVTEYQIAPMLLISFIENAFKHGVNAEEDSNIRISIEIKDENINLSVKNNKVKVQSETMESNGLGIENTRHRLQLMYPQRHELKITDHLNEFCVSLHIQLT